MTLALGPNQGPIPKTPNRRDGCDPHCYFNVNRSDCNELTFLERAQAISKAQTSRPPFGVWEFYSFSVLRKIVRTQILRHPGPNLLLTSFINKTMESHSHSLEDISHFQGNRKLFWVSEHTTWLVIETQNSSTNFIKKQKFSYSDRWSWFSASLVTS